VTIEKGKAWGTPGALPETSSAVHSDAEARKLVELSRRSGVLHPAPIGLLGGDLCRTLGGRGDERRLRSDEAMSFPVDLGAVLIDGRLHWFMSHLVAMRSWWRGRVLMVMNAQWLGDWNVGTRAHPNDGLFDVYDFRLGLGDRFRARRRLPTGTHVPHPRIEVRRTAAIQLTLDPPLPVALDGTPMGVAHHLSIRAESDALTVVV
jgi:hypothetical protein